MIEISRSVVRSFRAVLKKIATVLGNREPPAVVLFRTDRMGLHIQARNSQIALEHSLPGHYTAVEEVALPAEALGDFESRKDASVRFQASQGNVITSWQDKAVPQIKQYKATEPNRIPKMPALPPSMQRQPVELLKALADASETAGTDASRFTTTCLQLRGGKGQIVSTDGRQLLVQSGFSFGWDDDVLVPASQVFACRELQDQQPINLGRSSDYVTLSVGPWTLHLAVNKDGRFPNIEPILAMSKGSGAVLRLDPVDREFLLGNLDSLPGAGDDDSPVTLEGNGQVIVRSKANDQPTPTEVVLARSQAQGKKVAVATNRHYLAHALRLGFAEINVVSSEQPASCRDEKRQYVWQILGKDAVVKASDEAIRLTSTDTTAAPHSATITAAPVEESVLEMSEPIIENCKLVATEADHAEVMNGSSERSGIAQVLAEAEAIKDLLRQAYTRTHQLVTGLKRYRKQAHVVQTSLKALKQLQLVEA